MSGRGSPEAVAKRRAARALNAALTNEPEPQTDRRTERRRKRLVEELKEGKVRRSGATLKPIEVLSRAHDLLELGTPLRDVQKAVGKRYRLDEVGDEILACATRAQAAFGFDERVWSLYGIEFVEEG